MGQKKHPKSRKNSYDTELSLALENSLGFVPLTYKVRIKQLDAVRLQDIKEHYSKTHFTKNARFIIAGKIMPHRSAIINRLENLQLPGTHNPLSRKSWLKGLKWATKWLSLSLALLQKPRLQFSHCMVRSRILLNLV